MFLSNFSVKKPIATLVLIIGMMCMGVLALNHLRVNQNPDVEIPIIVVTVPYPGASPETSERELIQRLEKPMQAITGVTEVNAYANEGSATIVLRFDFKRNLIEASDDVRNAIAAVRYKLPIEMREPVLRRVDPSAQPIMNLALSSSSQTHRRDLAPRRGSARRPLPRHRRRCQRAGERFAAPRAVRAAAFGKAARIQRRRQRRHECAVAPEHQRAGGQGAQRAGREGHPPVGRIERPEDFSQVVVKRNGDTVVRLNQVADIKDGFADIDSAVDAQRQAQRRYPDHPLARSVDRRHRQEGARKSSRSARNCRPAPSWTFRTTAAKTPRTA
jgi:Cu/Ag efflux pump CusA